jgi:hypothetical protein
MVNATISLSLSGLAQQINAPSMLRFLVTPGKVVSAVIAQTGHLTSALGYVRLSCRFIASPLCCRFSRQRAAFRGFDNRVLFYFQDVSLTMKQNACQTTRIKTKGVVLARITEKMEKVKKPAHYRHQVTQNVPASRCCRSI